MCLQAFGRGEHCQAYACAARRSFVDGGDVGVDGVEDGESYTVLGGTTWVQKLTAEKSISLVLSKEWRDLGFSENFTACRAGKGPYSNEFSVPYEAFYAIDNVLFGERSLFFFEMFASLSSMAQEVGC